MPAHRKTKGSKPGISAPQHASAAEVEAVKPVDLFPFARYCSATGVYASLLVFIALYLPRTSLSFFTGSSSQSQIEVNITRGDALHLLTHKPARTVVWICGGVLILQVWWANWLRVWLSETTALTKSAKDAAELIKHKMERRELNSQRLAAIRNASLMTFITSVVFHITIILFGAPIVRYPYATVLFFFLLALLTAWTPAYTLGPPSLGSSSDSLVIRLTWIRLFAELSPRSAIERAIVYPAVGAVFGCWSGAIPIGLDWDRPWQAWPLTPAYGAISGYVLGLLGALVVNGVRHIVETEALPPAAPAQKDARIRQR
ncbi:hypothetical protein AcV7_002285 [Taiwanofungus camphoratus]|nr:hypothetical protein AcV7_002285 [Antrodia cinnamomea]